MCPSRQATEKRDDPESTNRLDCRLTLPAMFVSVSVVSHGFRCARDFFQISCRTPRSRRVSHLFKQARFTKSSVGKTLELRFQDCALHDGLLPIVSVKFLPLHLFCHHRPPVFRTFSRQCRDSRKSVGLELAGKSWGFGGSEVFLSHLVSVSFWLTL